MSIVFYARSVASNINYVFEQTWMWCMHLLLNSVYKSKISVNKYIAFRYTQSETADIVIIVRQ